MEERLMVGSAARVSRMSCGCGWLTVRAEGEQCWWHGPLLRVPSGAADVRQTAAGVVESAIYRSDVNARSQPAMPGFATAATSFERTIGWLFHVPRIAGACAVT